MPIQLTGQTSRKVKEENVTLKWIKPRGQGEPIEKYTVYQRILGKDSPPTDWVMLGTIDDNSICEYQAVDLERGKKYEFTVTATNRHGEGLKRSVVQVKVTKGKIYGPIRSTVE